MKEKEGSLPPHIIPKTLSESIYNYLKKSIIENKLTANQKINEQEIADMFRVSRTPVREALVRLAAEGFAEIDSHREIVVKGISYKELAEIFEVVGVLDSFASPLVVDKIDDRELMKLEKMTSKLEGHYERKEIEKFIDVNYAIHDQIWSHLSSNHLRKTLINCLVQIKRCKPALLSAFNKSEILDNSMKAHREILEAFRQKDVKKLEHIIQEHWNPPLL